MQDFIQNLPFPFLHSWGYFLLFAATILESMPFGFIIPGQAVIIFSGFLAKLKVLDLFDAVWVASLGAMIGDFLNYYIGKKYGLKFINKYGKYFFFKKEFFDKTKKLMNEHTGKTLIIGRFYSVTRAFAPFIAGSSEVPFKKFILFNIIGGTSWAASGIMLGFMLGQWYESVSKYLGAFTIAAVILAVFIVYLYKFLNEQKHIFAKYDIYLLLLNIFSLYIFFKMAEDVIDRQRIISWDLFISANIHRLWTPLLNKINIIFTGFMNIESVIYLSLIIFMVLLLRKRWRHIFIFFGSLGGGLLIAFSTKLIFHRARPLTSLLHTDGFSFPSSHATAAMIFLVLLIYFFKNDIKSKFLKAAFIAAGFFIFLLIAFSRIYLNAHWLSDVIAGTALGLFWTTLIILIFKYTAAILDKLDPKL